MFEQTHDPARQRVRVLVGFVLGGRLISHNDDGTRALRDRQTSFGQATVNHGQEATDPRD